MKKIVILCVFLIAFTAFAKGDDDKSAESVESSEESKKEAVAKKDDVTGEDEAAVKKDETKDVEDTPSEDDREGIDKLLLGKYELVTSLKKKDLKEMMKAMKFKNRHIRYIRRVNKVTVQFTKRKEKYTVWMRLDWLNFRAKFEPGKEYEDRLIDGRKFKSTNTFEGDNKINQDVKHTDFTCKNVYKFNKDGFKAKYNCNDKKAVQKFERVKSFKTSISKLFN